MAQQRSEAQVLYMNAILTKARNLALQANNTYEFDPQGRLLIDVSLSDQEKNTLLVQIQQQTGAQFTTLEAALGRAPTDVCTVSMDITDDEPLRQRYNFIQSGVLRNRGSVIALQQEFHFHLALTTRVYEAIFQKDFLNKGPELKQAYQDAMQRVNEEVRSIYTQARRDATKDGVINLPKLNQLLDSARPLLAKKAHAFLAQAIEARTQVSLGERVLKEKGKLQHQANVTTATVNDLLHTHAEAGIATFICSNANTSHHRGLRILADRRIITQAYTHQDGIVGPPQQRMQIRSPSIAVKKDLAEAAYIGDVAQKLAIIKARYHLTEQIPSVANEPRAFVYNLYTALGDWFGDRNGNLQTQSARHILCGAHAYNAQQLTQDDPIFCFVQNISVNGFGKSLGYRFYKGQPTREATLMTEMALVHSLGNTKQRQKIMQQYRNFLARPQHETYFSSSAEGKAAILAIRDIKNQWQQSPVVAAVANENPQVTTAKQCLRRLVAMNLHLTHDYAKLVQALSVFIEPVSIGGCKSGNERAQSINGRVAMLDAMMTVGGAQQASLQGLGQALTALAGQGTTARASQLKTALDSAYNQMGLQAGAALISLDDQGSTAKVETKRGLSISRNKAEESSLTNLQQGKAGALQAHKGLIGFMIKAWSGLKSLVRDTINPLQGAQTTSPGPGSEARMLEILSIAPPPPKPVQVAAAAVDSQSARPAQAATAAKLVDNAANDDSDTVSPHSSL